MVLVSAVLSGAAAQEDPAKAEAMPEKASEKDIATIKELLGKLASEEYAVRQKASDELVAMGIKAAPLVTATQNQSEDAEVRYRTKLILEKIAEAKVMEGMTRLASGLQYKVIKEGAGDSPGLTDTVLVHYAGKFKDGKEFDSSYKRGDPAQFPVNAVIRGWTEALQKMKPGSKWVLVIPPDLAYGARGAPGTIPPNATLIFDVELISVVKK